MSTDRDLPHSVRVIQLGDATVRIEPTAGYVETDPVTGFVRTHLREAPTLANMARALMAHAQAVLDELEGLSEAEFVAVCDAYVPLSKRVAALPGRVTWATPGGLALREPED